jgi:hypothetical protein
MHPADVAFVLEALPPEDRQTVWAQLSADAAGQVLVEVPDTVRASLVAVTPRDELMGRLLTLDPEDLALVADALDPDIRDAVFRRLESRLGNPVTNLNNAHVGRILTTAGDPRSCGSLRIQLPGAMAAAAVSAAAAVVSYELPNAPKRHGSPHRRRRRRADRLLRGGGATGAAASLRHEGRPRNHSNRAERSRHFRRWRKCHGPQRGRRPRRR